VRGYAGSRFAIVSSFAPIHARNNINIPAGWAITRRRRLEAGETLRRTHRGQDRSPR
jgi:hypothetical protein